MTLLARIAVAAFELRKERAPDPMNVECRICEADAKRLVEWGQGLWNEAPNGGQFGACNLGVTIFIRDDSVPPGEFRVLPATLTDEDLLTVK